MKHKTIIWSLLLILALGLSACSGSTPTQEAQQAEEPAAPAQEEPAEEAAAAEEAAESDGPNVLTVAATANVTTWDPVKSFSTEALYMANIYEQLLRVNPPAAAERFTPLLAESWEVNDDGTQWTFHLRPNVTFHDGEAMNAEAVKKSLEAAVDHAGASFIWLPFDSIEVVDDLTLNIKLTYAAPLDLIASSLYGAWIVSPKALDAAAADENYFETGVAAGTGPYMLESYTPDQEVLLTRNDDYWGGWDDVNHFDKVLVLITPEAIQQQQMLEGGEVDLALRIPQQNYADFAAKEGFTLVDEPSFFNYVGYFNTLRPPLDDPQVRQALSYAIPYQDIIDVSTFGFGSQSRGPVPAGVWPYSENVNQYQQDMDKARELLTAAGYPDGGFDLRLTYAAENETEERFAPLIKDAFSDLGVNVEIEAILFNQQWEESKSDPPNAQDIFLVLYWPTYSDAGTDNLWSLFHSSEAPFFNLSYWNNETFDKLVDEAGAVTVTDPEESQALYEEAMNLLVEEAPGLFFFDTRAPFVVPDHIQGFEYNLNYPFATFFYPLHN